MFENDMKFEMDIGRTGKSDSNCIFFVATERKKILCEGFYTMLRFLFDV